MSLDDEDPDQALVERARSAPFGVAAEFDGPVRSPVHDWRAAVRVADHKGQVGAQLVTIAHPDVHATLHVRGEIVAALVEEAASRLPQDARTIQGLASLNSNDEAHPGLRLDEIFPNLWRAVLS